MFNEVKALRWLALQFPHIDKPQDDNDRMCNAIHAYVTAGADRIEQLEEQLAMFIDNMR